MIEYLTDLKERDLLDVRELLIEYAKWLNLDLSFQGFSEEINTLPGRYSPPEGALILARVGEVAAGCVALRRLSPEVCEMKRLFVRSSFQGMGIGKQLVMRIIEEAIKRGYKFMRLDTLSFMKAARKLYTEMGFYPISPYYDNPLEGAEFMELNLENWSKSSPSRE
ncbi:MAG: hypothetical protein PWP57_1274 [Candidatus Atribacteria bacterium]|nr:hypothetical protein [Candidatus Atribacteria bacterium]